MVEILAASIEERAPIELTLASHAEGKRSRNEGGVE